MSLTAKDVEKALQAHAVAADAAFLQRFFKTGEGQYGAGDVFIGVRVPQTRAVCKQFKGLPLAEVQKLLDSNVHEHRLAAVILLTYQYPKADEAGKRAIYDLYYKNVVAGRINNWDIVDSSAPQIMGRYIYDHLDDREAERLHKLADSPNLWHRRVAIMGTAYFLGQGHYLDTCILAEKLLHDKEDLIQKAVGWQLREMGKRGHQAELLWFLDQHAHEMPRTMLRYAIEHLSAEQKARYMRQKTA